MEQSIELEYSHFGTESVFFKITFNTPMGSNYVDPQEHFSSTYIGDLKNMSEHILDGISNDSSVIKTGCMEPLFNISIYRFSEETDLYILQVELDTRKILLNMPGDSGPSLSITVHRSSLMDIAKYFIKIVEEYELKFNNCI